MIAGSRVVGLEPNPYMIDMLLEKQKSHPALVRVIRGYAEDLVDIQDESIDAVVSTLVLCSVRDLDKAIKEVQRVLVKVRTYTCLIRLSLIILVLSEIVLAYIKLYCIYIRY